jgi:hypothetical protein
MVQNLKLLFPLVEYLFIQHQLTTKEEFDRLYEQMQAEMQEPDFCALSFLLTVWGHKA